VTSTRPAGEKAKAQVREFEGLRLSAYQDGGGVWTIGYGHTKGVKRGQKITREEAEHFLVADLYEAEATIAQHLSNGLIQSLPQGAYDALVDMSFNLGPQVFANPRTGLTGLSRALNAGEFGEVPAQIMRWVYDNGKRVEGLVRRRKACCAIWVGAFK